MPEQPHGDEKEPRPSTPTGKITVTVVTSASSSILEQHFLNPATFPAIKWRKDLG